jgi:hypothetical protein
MANPKDPYSSGDLPDVEPGYDPDFPFPHLDPPELGNVNLIQNQNTYDMWGILGQAIARPLSISGIVL